MDEDVRTDADIDEKNILYDLLIPVEWKEITTILDGKKGIWRSIAAAVNAYLKLTLDKVLHPLRFLSSFSDNSSTIIELLNARLPWKLAITSDGTVLAVLKDDVIEIRTLLEGFERVHTSIPVSRDPLPEWRQLLWNCEDNLLAYGTSCGVVQVFSSSGSRLGQVGGDVMVEDVYHSSLGGAIANIIFLPPQKGNPHTWLSILCVLFYNGTLETYAISLTGPEHLHSFSFASYFPSGVGSMVFHSTHNLLLIGSCPYTKDKDGVPCGISGWRLLDAAPHWGPQLGQQVEKVQKGFSRLFSGKKHSLKHASMVFNMSLNPSGTLLAAIDVSGNLSLWEIPSFRQKNFWPLKQLLLSERSLDEEARKVSPLPIQVSWWSDEVLTLVSKAGEVFVLSIHSLANLLSGGPLSGWNVTPASNEQFFLLQCETRHGHLVHRSRVPSFSEQDGEDQDKDQPFFSWFPSNLVKQVLFFITDKEAFRPPTKKIRTVTKKYRLACMKAITPTESYERKLLNEDFEEALVLAREYGLDCDLVYQRQWQNYQVSPSTIQDHLSKVSKRSWVLQECLNRSTVDYVTTRCLLEYGLTRTNFRELMDLGDKMKELEDPLPGSNRNGSSDAENPVQTGESFEDIIKQLVDLEKLSPDQVSICQYRHMILYYLDILDTYNVILHGPTSSEKVFEFREYEIFRSENLVRSAVTYARDGDWSAVGTLFTYHGDTLLPHRLAILSNFPETIPPHIFQSLLPVMSSDGVVMKWEQKRHRQQDWVESEVIRSLCLLPEESRPSSGNFIYEENPEWGQYWTATSMDIIQTWFIARATEIEEFSGQVDSALELVELGMERNVKGLDVCYHELKTLCTLVYQCDVDSRLSLKKLKGLTDLEVIELMMKESDQSDFDDFVSDLEQKVLPFLKRLETIEITRSRGLLNKYLTNLSKGGLKPCLLLLQHSNKTAVDGGSSRHPILSTSADKIQLAISCVYACERSDQLTLADQIVECLPSKTDESLEESHLHNQVDALEHYISAAEIFVSYGVNKPISYIKDMQDSVTEAKQMMVMLTRVASRQQPAMTGTGWQTLLEHLLSLRATIFGCVNQITCYKIYIESLLCSGEEMNINFASNHLSLSPSSDGVGSSGGDDGGDLVDVTDDGRSFKLSYNLSIELVVSAAKEYFNSAASLMDKEMDLARLCLGLFPCPGAAVQAELNLIASLGLLDDFHVSMLPIQVRLCENKLDLVRSVLDSSPMAYKNYHKILRLCKLLNVREEARSESTPALSPHVRSVLTEVMVAEMTEDQGHSLILITLAALERKDYRQALELSSQLMEARFPPAWEVCRMMGLDVKIADHGTRMKLLDFSITHCPAEEISSLLQSRQRLHLQTQCLKCSSAGGDVEMSMAEPRISGSGGSGAGGGGAGKSGLVGRSVQHLVSKGAGAVQHFIRQRSSVANLKLSESVIPDSLVFLKNAASASSKARGTGKSGELELCYHPFYNPTFKSKCKQLFTYDNLGQHFTDEQVLVQQAILSGSLILNTQCQQEQAVECSEVLLKLAELSSGVDVHLTLGYLLSLCKHEDLDLWISRVSSTKFGLELVIYCICLHLYIISTPPTSTPPHHHPPSSLIRHVTAAVDSQPQEEDWDEARRPWVSLLTKYQGLLADLSQAEVLLSLGLGLDAQQFTHDEEYRHNTIILLARSSDQKLFSTALSLANHHGVDLWEVHMALLDSLLTTSNASVKEIEKKIAERNIMEVILNNPQRSADYLKEQTFPELSGKKYGILLLYYTILRQCANKGATFEEPAGVNVHIKLLTKFQSAIHGLDYKVLMSGEQDPLLLLTPVLSSTNVHVVAKLAGKIPCSDSGATVLTSGMVFCAFALKLFWKGDTTHSTKSSTVNWLKRYELCQEYLVLLTPDEFHRFILGIVMCEKALQQLSTKLRCTLVEKSVEYCKQKAGKQKDVSTGKQKDVSTGKQKDVSTGKSTLSYEELLNLLEGYMKHLTNLSHPDLQRHKVKEDVWGKFMARFDLSLAQPAKVHSLLLEMISSGVSPEAIETLLMLAQSVQSNEFSTVAMYKEALLNTLTACSGDDKQQSTDRLELIMCTISQHESTGGSVVTSRDVLVLLRPYCSDSSNPLSVRKRLFVLIEKHLFLSEEDHLLLTFYQTQSLLASSFSIEIDMSDVSDFGSQRKLFSTLLSKSATIKELATLRSLLDCWSESGGSSYVECWVDLLHSLSSRSDGIEQLVLTRAGLTCVPMEVDEKLFACVCETSIVQAAKYSLLCENDDMFEKIIFRLQQMEQSLYHHCDEDLMELLIYREKAAALRTKNSPLYHLLCNHLKADHETPREEGSGGVTPGFSPREEGTGGVVPGRRLNTALFSRLFSCPESEVAEKLLSCNKAKQVKAVSRQLYESGYIIEAATLLVSAQSFHCELSTLNDSLAYLKQLFQK